MEGIVAILCIFGLPPLLVFRYLKLRHERRMAELGAHPSAGHVAQLEATKRDLEARVENLESIVCSVDFELNAKLNRLASRQLLLGAGREPDPLEKADEAAYADTTLMEPAVLKPGSRLADRFVIERRLGSGGMGAVYLAKDEQLGEPVALKVIAGLGLFDPDATTRFRREASAARRVSHRHVVRLHDIGEADGLLFLSMEYVRGTSLSELIKQHGRLPAPQVRAIAAEVCQGLEAAHDAGVIHRDLKPANVLIDEQAHVKIIDFGLARLAHRPGMTGTGVILGTPEYMAPEQIRGEPVDARSDLYSLGAMLYHALAGSPAFSGDTPIAVSFAQCTRPVPALRDTRPELAEGWAALIEKAMAKDPADRFKSAAALSAALP